MNRTSNRDDMRCVLCKQPVAPWWFTTRHPGCTGRAPKDA